MLAVHAVSSVSSFKNLISYYVMAYRAFLEHCTIFSYSLLIWYFVRLDADVGEDEFDRSPVQDLCQDQDEGLVNEGKLPP